MYLEGKQASTSSRMPSAGTAGGVEPRCSALADSFIPLRCIAVSAPGHGHEQKQEFPSTVIHWHPIAADAGRFFCIMDKLHGATDWEAVSEGCAT